MDLDRHAWPESSDGEVSVADWTDAHTLVPTAGAAAARHPAEAISLGAVSLAGLQAGQSMTAPGSPDCQILFQTAGEAHLRVSGKPVRLASGQWLAVMAHPVELVSGAAGDTVALLFPADQLSRRLTGQIRSRAPAPLPVPGAARMCLELARACLAQAEPMTFRVADTLGESLVALARLALVEQLCETRVESMRETVRARIQAYVQRNLVDPDLSIARIAQRMQCTKRYLHKIFSDEGQTLSQYIWSERLERCRAQLCRAEMAATSITEIAFSCGFRNAAHFNRSFRARFGQPPRAYRRTMQQAA